MQAMGPFADGSNSNFACNISNYLGTNFGAFIKNCTIDQLINIRSTIYYDLSAYIDYGGCDYGGCDYGECDYGGFYGECEYGGCEYGECEYGGYEYGECDHGGYEYGECDHGGCEYGECDPNPNPYHNAYPYLPRYWSISVPPINFCPPYEFLSPPYKFLSLPMNVCPPPINFNFNFDQFSFFDIIIYFYVVIKNMHKLNSF